MFSTADIHDLLVRAHVYIDHVNRPRWLERISFKKVVVASVLGLLIWRYIRHRKDKRQLKKQLEAKLASRDKRIKAVEAVVNSNLPTPDEFMLSLPDKSVKELHDLIDEGKVKPVDLLHVFQRKALELYKTGNSGIAEFLTQAERWAQRLDNLEGTKIHKSPLFGIPISIKESCSVSGHDATLGLLKRCNMPSVRNGIMVKVLKRCGAIPFVLTMTTQAARALDDYNPVYGGCRNPCLQTRSPGGSSSGEAVLIGLHGSPIGLGSDIGGSCRIPAAFCGLVSLKPTIGRLSGKRMSSISMTSVFHLQTVPGPIGRKVDDLVQFMRAVLCDDLFSLDTYVIPMKFDETMFQGTEKPKLRIGFYRNFSTPNLPPTTLVVKNAIYEAVGALQKAGHEIIRFTVPHPEVANRLCVQALFGDGGQELLEHLADEPIGRQLVFLKLGLILPSWVKRCYDYVCHLYYGPSITSTSNLTGRKTGKDALILIKEIRDYMRDFEDAWNKDGPLDALICPAACFPAPPHNADPKIVVPSVFHTLLYNLLDYPAGTVPVGVVDSVDVMEAERQTRSLALEGKMHRSRLAGLIEGAEGLPLCVQVVARPYHEEIVLRVMRDIEAHVENMKQQ